MASPLLGHASDLKPQRLRAEARWYAKKLARLICVGAAGLHGGEGGLRILTYHRFANLRHDPFAVAPEDFARQMEWISRNGIAVSLQQVLEHLAGRRQLADGSILLTIDDGFASTYSIAFPLLRTLGIPAVVFLPAGLINQAPAPLDPEPRLNWEQVRTMAAAGIEIASHGWSHRSLATMSLDDLRREMVQSRSVLEEESGQAVAAFAYPFGTRADYDALTGRLLRDAGYRCAFTSQHGAISADSNVYELPRIKVESGEGMRMFAALCRGGLDPWRFVDRYLWSFQARSV